MKQAVIWRSPEEIVEIAFQRVSVVMMNEAHNGWRRCIRTRQIGQRILPVAHRAGVRHLAMEWLSARHKIEISNPNDPQQVQSFLQMHQDELTSLEFSNWREEQQAQNIIQALKSLPEHTPLLVWCGNSHLSKRPLQGWVPMGYQFKKRSGMDPFVIDQTRTVKFTDDPYQFEMVEEFAEALARYGGTAGFLADDAPRVFRQNTGSDAFLLSTQNELE